MKTIRDFFPEFVGAEKVKAFFGRFPTLHDCEVLSIDLDRELQADSSGPKVKIDFFAFDSEADPSSPSRRPAKLTMLFEKVEIEALQGFNHQNAFSDLKAEEYQCARLKERRLRFQFGEGWSFHFTAARVQVLDIQPFTPTEWFPE